MHEKGKVGCCATEVAQDHVTMPLSSDQTHHDSTGSDPGEFQREDITYKYLVHRPFWCDNTRDHPLNFAGAAGCVPIGNLEP